VRTAKRRYIFQDKIHDDTLSSLLDRIGILREELVAIERSLERMKDTESKKAKGSS
jgi:hypothetical protein